MTNILLSNVLDSALEGGLPETKLVSLEYKENYYDILTKIKQLCPEIVVIPFEKIDREKARFIIELSTTSKVLAVSVSDIQTAGKAFASGATGCLFNNNSEEIKLAMDCMEKDSSLLRIEEGSESCIVFSSQQRQKFNCWTMLLVWEVIDFWRKNPEAPQISHEQAFQKLGISDREDLIKALQVSRQSDQIDSSWSKLQEINLLLKSKNLSNEALEACIAGLNENTGKYQKLTRSESIRILRLEAEKLKKQHEVNSSLAASNEEAEQHIRNNYLSKMLADMIDFQGRERLTPDILDRYDRMLICWFTLPRINQEKQSVGALQTIDTNAEILHNRLNLKLQKVIEEARFGTSYGEEWLKKLSLLINEETFRIQGIQSTEGEREAAARRSYQNLLREFQQELSQENGQRALKLLKVAYQSKINYEVLARLRLIISRLLYETGKFMGDYRTSDKLLEKIQAKSANYKIEGNLDDWENSLRVLLHRKAKHIAKTIQESIENTHGMPLTKWEINGVGNHILIDTTLEASEYSLDIYINCLKTIFL